MAIMHPPPHCVSPLEDMLIAGEANSVRSVAYLGFHFGGGFQNCSGKVGVFAWREAPFSAWRSHALARGVRGHAPPRKFLKMVQFGAF